MRNGGIVMDKCAQCNLLFTDEWLLKHHEEDELGHFWYCEDCTIIYTDLHGRCEVTNIYYRILKRWKIIKKQKGNQLLDKWIKMEV
jgi:hypothetical protein